MTQEELDQLKQEAEVALQYLRDTDYLVLQQVELGNWVPKDKLDLRAIARAKVREWLAIQAQQEQP
jgi:hypothetical protein